MGKKWKIKFVFFHFFKAFLAHLHSLTLLTLLIQKAKQFPMLEIFISSVFLTFMKKIYKKKSLNVIRKHIVNE